MNQSTETNQKVAKSGQCTWQGRPLKWEDADEEAVSEEEEEETDEEGEEESKKSPENLVPV